MEPAWRQQGRGRGRSQEVQSERARPPQKERDRPGAPAGVWGAGRGGRTKNTAPPDPPHGEGGPVLTDFKQLHKVIYVFFFVVVFLCDQQLCRWRLSSKRSGSPTRPLLSDWRRSTSAPPLMKTMTTMRIMETPIIKVEKQGRSWRRPSSPTPTRQVTAD